MPWRPPSRWLCCTPPIPRPSTFRPLLAWKARRFEAVADALYEQRSIVRVLAMRRTLFVVPRNLIEVVERSSTDGVAAKERKRLEGFLADSGIDDPTGWLLAAASEIDSVLGPEGAPARELTGEVERLATKITMGAGTKHMASAGATSRVLAVLANEGLLVRGRPAGGWTGRQYRWYRRIDWLGSDSAEESGQGSGPADEHESGPEEPTLSRQEASVELVRRWLARFGPATIEDLKWWTGWTAGQLKAALAGVEVTEVDLHGQPGIVLREDLDDRDPRTDGSSPPWVALLPSLDPTPMGWKHRDWFLGDHKDQLFDGFGNVGPTIWVDGRIVGGWGQRPDAEIVSYLLEDVGSDTKVMIDDEIARLTTAIGETVVKPSFPTPLQKRLAT